MRRLFFRWAAAALLAGALMIPAAEAAQLQIDDRIVAVSYTHLDVYKRQGQKWA